MNEKINKIIDQLKSEFNKNIRQDDDCSWRIEILTSEGRSQVVTLIFKEQFYSEKDISRFISFSPIGPIFQNFNFESLLRKNSELDIGAIAIEDLKNQDEIRVPYVVFRASHLCATADYAEIWELIVKTAEYADMLEFSIYTKDIH